MSHTPQAQHNIVHMTVKLVKTFLTFFFSDLVFFVLMLHINSKKGKLSFWSLLKRSDSLPHAGAQL